jgi:hypothetical protein
MVALLPKLKKLSSFLWAHTIAKLARISAKPLLGSSEK